MKEFDVPVLPVEVSDSKGTREDYHAQEYDARRDFLLDVEYAPGSWFNNTLANPPVRKTNNAGPWGDRLAHRWLEAGITTINLSSLARTLTSRTPIVKPQQSLVVVEDSPQGYRSS